MRLVNERKSEKSVKEINLLKLKFYSYHEPYLCSTLTLPVVVTLGDFPIDPGDVGGGSGGDNMMMMMMITFSDISIRQTRNFEILAILQIQLVNGSSEAAQNFTRLKLITLT
jgi:hypothetical protein